MAKLRTKSAASRTGKAPKMVIAKVKGENNFLGHNGTKFEIVSDPAKATPFTEKYFSAIAKSKWGNKTWEKKAAPKSEE